MTPFFWWLTLAGLLLRLAAIVAFVRRKQVQRFCFTVVFLAAGCGRTMALMLASGYDYPGVYYRTDLAMRFFFAMAVLEAFYRLWQWQPRERDQVIGAAILSLVSITGVYALVPTPYFAAVWCGISALLFVMLAASGHRFRYWWDDRALLWHVRCLYVMLACTSFGHAMVAIKGGAMYSAVGAVAIVAGMILPSIGWVMMPKSTRPTSFDLPVDNVIKIDA